MDDRVRSRVAGMRLAVSIGTSSIAAWLLGPVVKNAGFSVLLTVMAGIACVTFTIFAFLQPATAPERA